MLTTYLWYQVSRDSGSVFATHIQYFIHVQYKNVKYSNNSPKQHELLWCTSHTTTILLAYLRFGYQKPHSFHAKYRMFANNHSIVAHRVQSWICHPSRCLSFHCERLNYTSHRQQLLGFRQNDKFLTSIKRPVHKSDLILILWHVDIIECVCTSIECLWLSSSRSFLSSYNRSPFRVEAKPPVLMMTIIFGRSSLDPFNTPTRQHSVAHVKCVHTFIHIISVLDTHTHTPKRRLFVPSSDNRRASSECYP